MATLYQKYRPRNFAEVVNQNHVKITLQSELARNDTAHAYLFSGPRGTGKTTMARVFAKALNCERRKSGESEPCGECASCEQVSRGASLDIVEIDAASHTGVDNVRETVIAGARVASGGSRSKVFVIDEVHMLSASAFNALLKTLEEPPQKAVFILATTEPHKLPATIISRCQRFDFKRISKDDIVQKLTYIAAQEKVQVAPEVLEAAARASEGHMRDAESLLGQIFSIGGATVTAEHADLIIPRSNAATVAECVALIERKDAAGAIRFINQLVDEGVDLKQFTVDLVSCARRLLLAKVDTALAERFAADFGQAAEETLAPVLQRANTAHLVKLVRTFTAAQLALKTAFIPQLPLELAVITLTQTPPASAAPAAGRESSAIPAQSVPLARVREKWNEVLVAVKKHNHSLSFILRACELREERGVICLAFKFKFHQERLTQPAVADILQQVFSEIYGAPLVWQAVLDEAGESVAQPQPEPKPEPETKTKPKRPDVDTILAMFGGKVVG